MEYVQSRNDSLRLRFRTSASDGLLFFADGNQGDYFILELLRGRLYLNINLGMWTLLLILSRFNVRCFNV